MLYLPLPLHYTHPHPPMENRKINLIGVKIMDDMLPGVIIMFLLAVVLFQVHKVLKVQIMLFWSSTSSRICHGPTTRFPWSSSFCYCCSCPRTIAYCYRLNVATYCWLRWCNLRSSIAAAQQLLRSSPTTSTTLFFCTTYCLFWTTTSLASGSNVASLFSTI